MCSNVNTFLIIILNYLNNKREGLLSTQYIFCLVSFYVLKLISEQVFKFFMIRIIFQYKKR